METNLGEIRINKEVIAKYAGSVAVESFGIIGMAMVNPLDGITKLLKREKLAKGIKVYITDNSEVMLDFHVIVSYGSNINATMQSLIENVKYKVENFCNMKVVKINIFVEGVRRID